jgi:hypothetical protein
MQFLFLLCVFYFEMSITLTSTNKDVSINSLEMREDYNFNTHGGYNKGNSVTNIASSIQGNNVNIKAKENVDVIASKLSATQDININAEQVNIKAANDTIYSEYKTSSKGFLSSSQTTTKQAKSNNIASNLNAKNVKITTSQEDINIIGSKAQVEDTLSLNSAKDINIEAGYDINHKESKTVSTSLFSGSNIFSMKMDSIGSYDKMAVGSDLSASSMSLKSNNANILGSSLSANKNINITSKNINIQAVQDVHKKYEEHKEISLSFTQALEGLGNLGLNMATLGQAKAGGDDDAILSVKASYSKTGKENNSINSVASNLKAGEDLTLKANTKEINIIGSKLSSGKDTSLDAANNVNILASYDKQDDSYKETSGYMEAKITSKEGFAADIDLTLKDENNAKSIAKNSSIRSKGNLLIKSKNDTTLIGSDLSSSGDTSMQTGGKLSIATAKNTQTSSVDNLNLHLHTGGIPNIEVSEGEMAMELGRATLDKIKKMTTETTASVSSIESDKNIDLKSDKSINIEGSNLNAKEDITLTANKDVSIKEAKETSKVKSDEIHGVATAKFVIKTEYAALHKAIKAVKDATKALQDTKKSYDKYKDEVSKQEGLYAQLQQNYENQTGFIELSDVEEFQDLLNDLKDDDKYYKANVVLATLSLATKATALAAQIVKTATAASETYGTALSASIELDVDAIEKQLKEYKEKSIASNLVANNINIKANNKASIQGSNLQAKKSINITAKTTDIKASRDNSSKNRDTQHQNLNISIGTSGFSMSASVDTSGATADQVNYTNSQLQANNININTDETTTIKGANLKAEDTLSLNTKNLEVASLQNKSKTREHSMGMSAGYGGGNLSSLGANMSNANSSSKETLLTTLTGNRVNVRVADNTKLRGATIAAIDTQGEDNSNLNLSTKTLTASSLNNRYNSKSSSVGVNTGGAVQDAKITNVGLDYSNDRSNTKTKTLATLGKGNIQVSDKENSQTRMLNTDIANNEVDIYNISSHKGLKGELDTRLLTKDGRNKIAENLLKTGVIGDTINQIATNKTVGITDLFSNIKKEYITYDAIKEKIAQDPALAKALSNPKLSEQQREEMMDGVVNAVMIKLGYNTYNNKLVSTNEKGRDNKDVKGFHSLETGDSYINQENITNGNEGLIQVAGTEAQRAIDAKNGSKFEQSQEYRDERSLYSQNYGTNVANYTNFALDYIGEETLSTTNSLPINLKQVTSTPSIFNTQTVNNNLEFGGLDKSKGDNRQLAKEEKSLNYTQNAQDLKQALVDTSPNLSKQDIDNIFEITQKGMVNKMDNYMMNLQMNTTHYKNQKEDIKFVSNEAQIYFTEASKNQVYMDRNTLTNRPMMDTNNYNDSTYNPSSNSKIVKNTIVSVGLTAAGLVSSPEIAIPAWTIDTYRNYNSNGFDLQNTVAPGTLGNPYSIKTMQRTGAGLSIYNTVENISNYSDAINQLEQTRDSQNNQELQNIYNSEKSTAKTSNTQSNTILNSKSLIKVNLDD